ncbi:chitinase-3-like protein 2 isoform X2 [Oryctolagus cuniculus]|uniref:chitinase-3-like protein 2 isoform X2 n=1 Tax=Oryctolagus cuniculus TaxID=9986 RepID=UPI00222EC53F|nr:chitinase-3-like protein 2 isoform X2 [Oryctolagus cuniculus]
MGASTMNTKSLWAGLVVLLLLQGGSAYKLVCYFTSWSQDRQEPGRFTPENIDPFLCSHLIYSFASISNNKIIIKDKNPTVLHQAISDLKAKNPKLKILLSIGGYLFGSKGFHPMVDSSKSQLEFITSVILLLRNHNFDGLDVSWIYPDLKDKTHFTALIHELSEAFQKDSINSSKERLLLTAGVSAGRQMVDNSYQIEKLAEKLDFINLLSFDFHGSWEKPLVTGHNSPLRKGHVDKGPSSYYNVICQFLQGAKITRLQDQQVPYAVKGNQWVGYDDVQSLEAKVQFLKNLNLGGAMIWSIDMDDFTGTSCNQGPFPLVQAVKRNLGSL